MPERAALVARLIRDGPLAVDDLESLNSFGWDSPEVLVVLTRADARCVLERSVNGKLSIEALSEWANQIEAREDIGFESGHTDFLQQLIFELANPAIQGFPTTAASSTAHSLAVTLRRHFVTLAQGCDLPSDMGSSDRMR